MLGSQNARKFIHTIRQDGILTATIAVANHTRRTLAGAVEGLPGHYRLRHRQLERRYAPEDITPRWVSPDEITHLTGEYELRDSGHLDYVPHFKPREASWESLPYEEELTYGSTVEGDWDQHREPFSKLLMSRGIREHYVDELPWSETVYYRRLIERFRSKDVSADTAETLAMERCKNIEQVYRAIDTHGYRSQRELNGHPLHEITVTIARDGTLLYNCEGRHRLSIAKVLDIEAIPVLVLARHAEYESEQRQYPTRRPRRDTAEVLHE